MTTEETTKGNALLAKFQGAKFLAVRGQHEKLQITFPENAGRNALLYKPEELQYHSDISWLWPCWVKFREIDFHEFSKNYEYTTYHKRIVGAFAIGDIPDIFAALVAGVEWYNSIKEEGK